MFSLEAMEAMDREAMAKARKRKKQPYIPASFAELNDYPPFPFPMLGTSYVPDGWQRTDTQWFVDSSGFGRDDEPALSIGQFLAALKAYHLSNPDHGFAITEAGQFQVYIAAYEPIPLVGDC